MNYWTLFIFFLLSCSNERKDIRITDKNYYEIGRKYSSDRSKLLLRFGINQGSMGKGEVGTAILEIKDTLENLIPFTIDWHIYDNIYWINNDSVAVLQNYIRKMRSSKFIDSLNYKKQISGVQIVYRYADILDSNFSRKILLDKLSPNNQYRLVAFRYTNRTSEEGFLNISVLKLQDSVSKYGNIFISDIGDEIVLYCNWSKDNELLFSTTGSYQYILKNYLVENRPEFPIKIIVRDDLPSRFKWSEENKIE